MTLELQFKIKSNPDYIRYLRENSSWYKILNRDPSMFKKFIDNVKTEYQLRTSDRISRALNTIELFQNIVTNLK